MVGWHHQLNGHEFEQAPRVGDGQGSLESCSPWGRKEPDMTEWLNWTDSWLTILWLTIPWTKCGSLEKGMANHFSILALRTSWTVWKGKKIGPWKMNSPGLVGAQFAIGDQWRNNSRKSEETKPKQKQHTVVDVTGEGSKVQCCKEQYCKRNLEC